MLTDSVLTPTTRPTAALSGSELVVHTTLAAANPGRFAESLLLPLELDLTLRLWYCHTIAMIAGRMFTGTRMGADHDGGRRERLGRDEERHHVREEDRVARETESGLFDGVAYGDASRTHASETSGSCSGRGAARRTSRP